MENYKIIHKKPTEYDNSTISDSEHDSRLDESILTFDIPNIESAESSESAEKNKIVYSNSNTNANLNELYENFIDFLKSSNPNNLNESIKNFISVNKLEQNQIIYILTKLKNNSDKLDNNNNTLFEHMKNIENSNNTKSESTNDADEQEKEQDKEQEQDEEQEQIFKQILLSNDINMWLFIGAILIGIIMVVMIVVHKS